jgi:branched-subunit amino acid permease
MPRRKEKKRMNRPIYQPVRRIVIPLSKSGVLAVANEIVGWEAGLGLIGRVTEVELFLGNTGATSGQTTVDIKKNGTSILQSALAITQGSATKRVRTAALAAAAYGEPFGLPFQVGDYFRVDVSAIPGTASQDLIAYLHIALTDI